MKMLFFILKVEQQLLQMQMKVYSMHLIMIIAHVTWFY